MGVPAELALLSLELDADRLAAAGVVPDGAGARFRTTASSTARRSSSSSGPATRRGSRTSPISRGPGIKVVHPDPLTSGGANWAILAEYGAGLRESGAEAGNALLRGIWRNVTAQAASARAARTQFENGFGDALITYEQEALVDRARASSRPTSSTRAARS